MTDERRAYYHRLLDNHDSAFQAFREASHAFDQAMDGLAQVMAGIRQANEAQGRAIEAMMAANREVLVLLNFDGEAP
jgi:flagellar biosynthesis/type III secretory pathway chaperone